MRVVWITGAAGFTGRSLSSYLAERFTDLRLIGLGRTPTHSKHLHAFRSLDIADATRVDEMARQYPPDIVIHLAGVMPPTDAATMWSVNVGATTALLSTIARARPGLKFLSIGSAAEYGPNPGIIDERAAIGPSGSYGLTKAAQTSVTLHLGRALNIDALVARPFNLVGPGLPPSLVAASLIQQIKNGGRIRAGNLSSVRDFVDVRDAVAAYWDICDKGEPGAVYNVCTGTGVSIALLLDTLERLTGSKLHVEHDAARLKPDDRPSVIGSPAKLCALTGWEPRFALTDSLRDMLR